jgi:hypothetical protein
MHVASICGSESADEGCFGLAEMQRTCLGILQLFLLLPTPSAAAAGWLLQLMKKKHAWMGVRELQEKAKAANEEAKQAQQAFNVAQADANHDERPLKCVRSLLY